MRQFFKLSKAVKESSEYFSFETQSEFSIKWNEIFKCKEILFESEKDSKRNLEVLGNFKEFSFKNQRPESGHQIIIW